MDTWIGFIHIIHEDGRRNHSLKVNILSLDGSFNVSTSQLLTGSALKSLKIGIPLPWAWSSPYPCFYPNTGIGKPTQPRSDQESIALPPLALAIGFVGKYNMRNIHF
jgi:hypothetical protein